MENDNYISNPEINFPITMNEIEIIYIKLRLNKATGIDNLPNEVLKNQDVLIMLYTLFSKYFYMCLLPSVWLKAVINHIPKGANNDPLVPLNYRGIILLSCVGKVFSGIINYCIVNYCERNGIYEEEQNGLRIKRSCEDHIFTLTSIVRNRLTQKKDTFCCLIDKQNAFDWIDRDLLMYKLLKYNINGNIYKCVKAMFNHPLECVKVNDNVTEWFETASGVRQGHSLSTTLFSLFINDLIKEVKDLNLGVSVDDIIISILSFADDLVKIAESEVKLQSMIKCVEMWCKKWRLKVNTDKTKVVNFRSNRKRCSEFNFTFDNSPLNVVNKYKYLGIILEEHLDFNLTASVLANAAGRAFGAVRSKFKTLKK